MATWELFKLQDSNSSEYHPQDPSIPAFELRVSKVMSSFGAFPLIFMQQKFSESHKAKYFEISRTDAELKRN